MKLPEIPENTCDHARLAQLVLAGAPRELRLRGYAYGVCCMRCRRDLTIAWVDHEVRGVTPPLVWVGVYDDPPLEAQAYPASLITSDAWRAQVFCGYCDEPMPLVGPAHRVSKWEVAHVACHPDRWPA